MTDSMTTTQAPETDTNADINNHNNENQEEFEGNTDNNESMASSMFGSYTDIILLILLISCICCTLIILSLLYLKRRKDRQKAIRDTFNIEMAQNQADNKENDDEDGAGGRDSGTLESAIDGNGDIFTTNENVRTRGGTFDSVQSQTLSNTNLTNQNGPQQMMPQQSLPDYSQNMSMQQQPFPSSYSAAQNYLNISYANGVNSNSYQQHGSYPNQYNDNLVIPNASTMNGSYSSSMNNGNPLLLNNVPSNVSSAFSQYSKAMGPLVHHQPSVPTFQSSYSMHQSQVQPQQGQFQGPGSQQRLPLNGGISLPVISSQNRVNQQRKSSDANSEVDHDETYTAGFDGNGDINGIDEEKEFEAGLHVIYDHNQDEHNSDTTSENSDATSEEGVDVINGDAPATPDDDMWGAMNECDIVTAGGDNNNYVSPGGVYENANVLRASGIRNFMSGDKIKNRNFHKKKNVRFNMHMNNDSVYNQDDAQSEVGGVTDIGDQ